jgi:hypothetical protein
MTHMQFAAGVGKHRQAVIFFAAGIFNGGEAVLLLPELLSAGFDVAWGVLVVHWRCQVSVQRVYKLRALILTAKRAMNKCLFSRLRRELWVWW